ncbi:LysR family transcriptional regulator substrate-binding protein [Cryptosporangium phraense]|uniref:LysR family transcriptional regulator substrate-binding protein n=1 Tax=Cryptosporangium phraense TaxID=2593070 RepID=UPI001F0E34AB|nr:LysR family transcriptional regulator substrate-binding protein [Cryptosporangium phraense]
MRDGLTATVRLGAIPTAVPATAVLSEALVGRHPLARMRIEVLPAPEILRRLHAYELDAGLTYLPDEPLAESQTLELYRERYVLLTPADGPFAGRATVGWAEAAELPLCALVSGMQNRGIIDAAMRAAGAAHAPVVEAETVDALYAHLATGRWSGVIAHTWLRAFGEPAGLRAVPLAPPAPAPAVGLVTGDHGPSSLVSRALSDAVRAADLSRLLAWEPT